MEWIYELKQIKQAADQLWQTAGRARVFAFHATMGAGKTTFIHALCDIKGVKDVVGSPTFSIINEYAYNEGGEEKKIFHIDLYRLKDEKEALETGIIDCLYGNDICLVEWPEKISSQLPPGTVHIYIDIMDEQTRKLKIKDN